ncbi:MAG: hypothetical protein FJ189_05820 [Gammaproteobacteria bacterium]|nr:hypothetical protein [Gammaproteobacteria bacterium]
MRIPQPTAPGPTAARRYRTLALAAAALLAGCAAYEAAEAPSPAIPAMPYSVKEGALSLGADPHVEAERQEAVFSADFASLSIVPVYVVVGNSGSRPVRIGPEQFTLALPGSEATAPRPGSEVALMFPPERGVAHYATSGVSILGGLAGPIGALAGRVAGMLGGLMLSRRDSEAAEGRRDDYARKELPTVQLERGQFARGFLFFVLPRGTPAFDEALLTFSPPAETAVPALQLTLKGLHVEELPASSRPSPFH